MARIEGKLDIYDLEDGRVRLTCQAMPLFVWTGELIVVGEYNTGLAVAVRKYLNSGVPNRYFEDGTKKVRSVILTGLGPDGLQMTIYTLDTDYDEKLLTFKSDNMSVYHSGPDYFNGFTVRNPNMPNFVWHGDYTSLRKERLDLVGSIQDHLLIGNQNTYFPGREIVKVDVNIYPEDFSINIVVWAVKNKHTPITNIDMLIDQRVAKNMGRH